MGLPLYYDDDDDDGDGTLVQALAKWERVESSQK